MADLWGDFWGNVFDSFGQNSNTHRMGCLRVVAWMFLLLTLAALTGGLFGVLPGPWVWVATGVFAALSLVAFYLSSRPADDSEDEPGEPG
jgi:amino acid transporter